MEQGLDAREAGDDVHALDLFQRAYAEEPAPRTAAQLGLCEQALGSWVEAQRHVREALATSDTWVRRNRSSLEHALTAIDEQVGTIEVLGGVDGASVRWGGQSLGALPMTEPASVVVGRATLEVTADGYVPYAIELTVRGGELTRQVVRLEEVHATPPPSAGTRGPGRDRCFDPRGPGARGERVRCARRIVDRSVVALDDRRSRRGGRRRDDHRAHHAGSGRAEPHRWNGWRGDRVAVLPTAGVPRGADHSCRDQPSCVGKPASAHAPMPPHMLFTF